MDYFLIMLFMYPLNFSIHLSILFLCCNIDPLGLWRRHCEANTNGAVNAERARVRVDQAVLYSGHKSLQSAFMVNTCFLTHSDNVITDDMKRCGV